MWIEFVSFWLLLGIKCALVSGSRKSLELIDARGESCRCKGSNTATEMNSFRDIEANKALIEETPLERLGESKDVTGAALFLTSDMGSFITGELVQVTGGRGMHQ